jgi:hypothetical protein
MGGDPIYGCLSWLWLAQLPMPVGPPDSPIRLVDQLALADLGRFPPLDVVETNARWANAHAKIARKFTAMYPSEADVQLYAIYAQDVANAWNLLYWSHGYYFGLWGERVSCSPNPSYYMDALERLIGFEDYIAGRMPATPLYRIRDPPAD